MCRIAVALALVPLTALPVVVQAQEITASFSAYGPFGLDDLDGQLPPSAEFRLTIPITDRFAAEPFMTFGRDRHRRSAGLEGFYGAQIRQRIAALTRKDVYAFATYGAAAYYSQYGSSPFIIGHLGFGMHQRLTTRLAFRPELHVVTFHIVPIGARYVAGLAVTVGR
jgi:hypothetical protein